MNVSNNEELDQQQQNVVQEDISYDSPQVTRKKVECPPAPTRSAVSCTYKRKQNVNTVLSLQFGTSAQNE